MEALMPKKVFFKPENWPLDGNGSYSEKTINRPEMAIVFKVCMYRMRFQIIMTPLMMKNGQKANGPKMALEMISNFL